jgi:hypothetical protein
MRVYVQVLLEKVNIAAQKNEFQQFSKNKYTYTDSYDRLSPKFIQREGDA